MAATTESSVPSWSYDEDYYRALTDGSSYCIKIDPQKGKGLFSTRRISEGDIVHEEVALCCSQNLDDVLSGIPVCGNCLVSLESSRRCVARVTGSRSLAMRLPFSKMETRCQRVKCLFAEFGCNMLFCSVRCRQMAWSRFHLVGCSGNMTEERQEAYNTFIHRDWVCRGVDYSDTVILAFRFICMTLTSTRLHRQSLEMAYKPIAQLIKAPLSLFHFTYLLPRDEEAGTEKKTEEEEKKEGKPKVIEKLSRWEAFQMFLARHRSGEVDDTTDEFLLSGITLIDRIVEFTEEERSFFTAARWSELLGAVLLNGQERSPPSNYDRLKELVQRMPNGDTAMEAFEQEVRVAGKDVEQLLMSSRGQGIYTIGCLLNHSCEPNVQVVYDESCNELLSVVALRDIEAGEELHISYIEESMSYPERQQELYEHYLFICRCPKCERESTTWKLI